MDTATLKRVVEKLVPGALLQCVNFGRSGEGCAWIESSNLVRVGAALKQDSQQNLDWLENLSAMQMDDVIVLTYFLRSRESDQLVILRSSVSLGQNSKKIPFPSVVEVWPMAQIQEKEISEMFGIQFSGSLAAPGDHELWGGFPLRKDYSLQVKIDTPSAGRID